MLVCACLQKCSVEVFQEGLVAPCLASGNLVNLQDQMSLLDPSLECWNTYLTATCRYLNKMKYMNALYQFQLFMKVRKSHGLALQQPPV